MNNDRRPYRVNGKEVVVDAENVNFNYTGIDNVENVAEALDFLKENGGGGGGGLQPTDIINDLTTGGTDKALSAEMGKELNEAINDKLSEVIVNSLDPGDVAVINDVTTGGSTNVLSAEQGKKLNTGKQARMEIFVAASDAPSWQKAGADYICDGTNDEVEIQTALNAIANTGGRVRLSSGTFWIDSWQNVRHNYEAAYGKCALMFPYNKGVEYIIEGDSLPLAIRTAQGGTIIRVSNELYEATTSNDYCCILAPVWSGIETASNVALKLLNVRFVLPWNQKPLMCVDTFGVGRVYLQNIDATAWTANYDSEWVPVGNEVCPIPVQGCVAIRGLGGGNWGSVSDFRNIMVSGFYEGFKFAGEHIVGINLAALYCYYPYSFGNWAYSGISGHPMTFINCNEEHCCCGPYFSHADKQQIDMLQYNVEMIPWRTPGGVRIKNASVKSGENDNFRGRIEYTIMANNYVNTEYPFWEEGDGHNFHSKNMIHPPAAGTATIRGWIPDYMEQVYDTTLGMLLICTDTATKTWRDCTGTVRITSSS